MSKIKKRIIKNLFAALLSQAVTFILAFLIPRLFLVNFGSEAKGLISTITQIFNYLWLLEAGVGLATTQALYGPVSRQDEDSINAIMTATHQYYKKTGYLYLTAVVLFAVVFSLGSKSSFQPWVVFVIVLMQGLPSVLTYLVQGKYRLLLEAEGKAYIFNNLQTAMNFFMSFGKVFLLYLSANILLVQSVSCMGAVIQVVCLVWYVKRNYRWLDLKVKKPDYEAISEKSAVLIHQISGVIFNNTDVLLLSAFCGYMVSSVYTVYQMFFQYMETLITTLSSSINFSLGQLFHSDRERFLKVMDLYETVYLMIIFILNTAVYLFILPLIAVYTRGINDIEYIDSRLPILFVLISLLANGKMPTNLVINIAERFSNTRPHAIIEVVINLVVSVFAIWKFGICGGLMGTIAALLFRANVMIIYANVYILGRNPLKTYKKWGAYFLVFLLVIRVLDPQRHMLNSYPAIFGYGCVYGCIIALVFVVFTCFLQPSLPRAVLQMAKNWRK
ncbi:MAG: sugar isomerase [Lachnospiraceae bacterium]|nr:sugar isomerase [Lachnospiraceae bacterium]